MGYSSSTNERSRRKRIALKPTVTRTGRFRRMHAWANRILRVGLGNMRIEVQETEPYVPAFLGARGIAARSCWQEYAEPVEALAAGNPLMIFAGALTGSRSPYSGRSSGQRTPARTRQGRQGLRRSCTNRRSATDTTRRSQASPAAARPGRQARGEQGAQSTTRMQSVERLHPRHRCLTPVSARSPSRGPFR
jgi:type IV secretory pathway TrbL component